mmetsp:Transcript_12483/g.25914  ORF Transcript_12483/g.25914 Transcript_12483/m.25914 type:complete len:86 (-) Transcript_12483:13-270(-)
MWSSIWQPAAPTVCVTVTTTPRVVQTIWVPPHLIVFLSFLPPGWQITAGPCESSGMACRNVAVHKQGNSDTEEAHECDDAGLCEA